MFTQPAALEHIRAFAEELRKLDVPLEQVFLFGSYARNEQREESDMDVALVADDFTGAGFLDVRRFASVLARYPYFYIEPHTFSPEQFTDWNPFVQEIKRTGIVIGEWAPAKPAPQPSLPR